MRNSERLGVVLFWAAISLALLIAIGYEIANGQRRFAWLGGSIMLFGVFGLILCGYSALFGVGNAFPTHMLALGVILVGWFVLPRNPQ